MQTFRLHKVLDHLEKWPNAAIWDCISFLPNPVILSLLVAFYRQENETQKCSMGKWQSQASSRVSSLRSVH